MTNDEPAPVLVTRDRDASLKSDKVGLLGLDHPLIAKYMDRYRVLPEEAIGIRVQSEDGRRGVLSIWHVVMQGDRGETRSQIVPLAVDH